ncbi:MAG: thiamine ABC transporter substrate binding subunit [Alphaproteobacteria bacterium]|nr:thiamine ABC transporter substrate binding subunit [Alphaproteobacteria bacterium]
MEDNVKILLAPLLALLAIATPVAAKETLTIYTYESFTADWGPGPKIKTAFEKTCDCTLAFEALVDGVSLLNRLKLEGGNTRADIVLGLDTNLTAEARAMDLFGRHGLDPTLARTPVPWADEYFMPFDYAHFAVIYDSEAMPRPPASLTDLVDGDPNQKIILEDPRSSTPGLGFLLWMRQVYGDGAADAWRRLKPRILTTTPGWSEAYALFTKGEAPMVLSYTTSPAYHMIVENSARFQAASFAEGHYLQIEVAGLIENSPRRALAEKFLRFMMEPGFQDEIPTNNWMFPAGTTSSPLPEAFGKLVKPERTLYYAPEEVASNHRAWIDEWLNAVAK